MKEIWVPEEDSDFLKKFGHWKGKYDILISPVGYSPEPVRRTILAIMPEKIYFIVTSETEPKLHHDIIEKLNLPSRVYSIREIRGDSDEVYSIVKEIIRSNPGKKISIDITGGKKSVVGMATVAGAFYGIDLVYNDYREYDSVKRKPVPGSEFITVLNNPLMTSGDLLMSRARKQFNNYNFSAAISLFNEIKRVGRDPREAEVLLLVSEGLKAWSDFDFKTAYNSIKAALQKRRQYSLPDDIEEARLQEYIDFLEPVRDVKSTMDLQEHFENISSRDRAVPMIVSLYQWAKRYEDSRRYNEAILGYYRVVELISQYLLGQYGINTADTDSAEAIDDSVRKMFTQERRAIAIDDRIYTLRKQIGLVDSYVLLQVLKEESVKDLDVKKEILSIIEPRNRSLLIHAWYLGGPKEAKNLRNLCTKLMNGIKISPSDIEKGCFIKLGA